FQASQLLVAAVVGSYLVDVINETVVIVTFLIPFAILVGELVWVIVRKRRKKPPVTGLGKRVVKLAGWVVEGVWAGEFFAIGYIVIRAIPEVGNVAFVFLGILDIVTIFIIVTLGVLAVKV